MRLFLDFELWSKEHFAVLFSHQHGERKQCLCKCTLLEISEEIYQHFAVLFSHQHGERKQFLCKCSFLEIYQEQVYDLLDPAAANLQLRENMKKGVFVDGLVEQVVATPTEAYQVLCVHAHGIMHYIYVLGTFPLFCNCINRYEFCFVLSHQYHFFVF